MHQMPPKDPADVQIYTRNASSFLDTGETIASSAWEIAGPDTVLALGTGSRAPSYGASSASCWLTGGTELATYIVKNTVVTSASPSRTKVLSFSVKVLKR